VPHADNYLVHSKKAARLVNNSAYNVGRWDAANEQAAASCLSTSVDT